MRARDFILEDNPDYDEDRYLKSDPGTPLNFPKGTTLVNVSDVYDWYKLGMAVSDLDDADPRTFNKGVPHTVFAFGSEEEEHKMIPLLKRLGFSLHDIDSPEDYEKAIRADEAISYLEEMKTAYKEIEFVCVNPRFPDATDPELQKQMYQGLQRIDGVIPLWQEWGDYSQGQASLSAIYKDRAARSKILALAKQLGVQIDIEQPVSDKYVDRAIQGAHEGQIAEMAGEIHGGVRKALMAKGYEYLGSGIDKQAYLEPGTGQVLIVFGYRKNFSDFSPDQRMFIDWINYCNKNANNPHLPKFSGFESFQFSGKNYIQARMEPLRELPDDVGMLVAHIDDVVNAQKKKQNFNKQIKNISSYATFASAEEGDSTYYELEDTIEYLGGEQAAMNLLQTVYQVKQFARQHQFTVDLHRGNYMARSDGTIVVNDPFVLWLTSSGNRQSWRF